MHLLNERQSTSGKGDKKLAKLFLPHKERNRSVTINLASRSELGKVQLARFK